MMEVMQKAAAQTLSALPMKFTFIWDKLAMGIIGYFSDQMSPWCSELLVAANKGVTSRVSDYWNHSAANIYISGLSSDCAHMAASLM